MHQQSIPISPSTKLFLESIAGDLQVIGWERPEVFVESANKEDVTITQQDNQHHVSCSDDCSIYVPHTVDIDAGQVQGDAQFNFLSNHLHIDEIHGAAIFQKVSEVQLNTITGDLLANQINGHMIIDQIRGNGILSRLHKGCVIQKVFGGLQLYEIDGDISASAEGDITLCQNHSVQSSTKIISAGDIHCQMPENIDAQVTLKSHANTIKIKLRNESMLISEPEKTLTIGNGNNQILLSAGGEIIFSCQKYSQQIFHDFETDFDIDFQNISINFKEQLESQFKKQIDMLNTHMEKLSETLSQLPIPDVEVDHMVERARRSSVIAAQRAREKMERTQRKLERKIAEAKRKSEQKSARYPQDHHTIHIQWDVNPKRTPPEEPISPDERLMVLKMLEQGKISLDEAENLLRALEGQEE